MILASDAGPKSLRDLITVRYSTYNLRGTTILDLPKVKSTTFGLRSWRYAASKLWNALPDESRKIQTFTTFKNYLKTLDLTGLWCGEDLSLIIFTVFNDYILYILLGDYIVKFLYFNISWFLILIYLNLYTFIRLYNFLFSFYFVAYL